MEIFYQLLTLTYVYVENHQYSIYIYIEKKMFLPARIQTDVLDISKISKISKMRSRISCILPLLQWIVSYDSYYSLLSNLITCFIYTRKHQLLICLLCEKRNGGGLSSNGFLAVILRLSNPQASRYVGFNWIINSGTPLIKVGHYKLDLITKQYTLVTPV